MIKNVLNYDSIVVCVDVVVLYGMMLIHFVRPLFALISIFMCDHHNLKQQSIMGSIHIHNNDDHQELFVIDRGFGDTSLCCEDRNFDLELDHIS